MSAPLRACSRATALALALSAGLLACGSASERGAREHAAARRGPTPVVLVVIDTLRADRLGVYGHERPTSPVLDALAAEGIVFERAFAQSTWTKPTTASILTGLYPSSHGVLQPVSTLEERHSTLAEILGAEGYATAAFVANGFVSNREFGYGQGFDHFEGEHWDTPANTGYLPADGVVDHTLAWLDGQRGDDASAPFFLYVHVADPHTPYDAPAAWQERFVRPYDGPVDGWLRVEGAADLTDADFAHLLDQYDAEIAFCDHELGRLFDALKERGLWDEALVVVLADHGEEFGEHGGLRHGPGMYQEVVHVPLIVKPPAGRGFPAGVRHDGVAMQVDVVPTVLDAVDLEPPGSAAELPGTSLLERAMLGRGAVPEIAFGEVVQQRTARAMVVEGQLKYVRQLTPRPRELLFDLEADPREREPDALGDGLRARLRQRLDEYASASERQASFALVVTNDGDEPRELHVRVAAETAPVGGFAGIGLELRGRPAEGIDEPVDQVVEEWGGSELHVTRVILRVSPHDSDGFRFAPAPEDEAVLVDVRLDGEPLPLAAFRLGAARQPAASHPVRLERSREELLSADPVRSAGAGELCVHLWRELGLRVVEKAFDPDEIEALQQLGYFGGQDGSEQ